MKRRKGGTWLAGGATAAGLVIALAARRLVGAPDPALLRLATPPAHSIWLDSLDVSKVSQEYGSPRAGRSVDGHPLTLRGTVYPHGLGTHALSQLTVGLKGAATHFMAVVGVDDEANSPASVTFQVWVDRTKVAETGVLHHGDPPQVLYIDLTGARRMTLLVGDAGDGNSSDHADWGGAILSLIPGARARPEAVGERPPPIASGVSLLPAIHGPRVVGTTPGRPFLLLIPATGAGLLTFSARHLPAGLTLDRRTGIITGSLLRSGNTVVELAVRGPRGSARRALRIVGGAHRLALTPPMGWNSWNVWGNTVSDRKARDAADWMIKSGLAAHGYQYINIDAGWAGKRDSGGQIHPNDKFPEMKALADYVHRKGLKLGLYAIRGSPSDPGRSSSFGHERQDAGSYARWGVDYLKYEAEVSPAAELMETFRRMHSALDQVPRDIVYNLSEPGLEKIWEWGAQVGGNSWRTTGDLGDTWRSVDEIGFSQDGHERYAGPGHWNDPDMLTVGHHGGAYMLSRSRLTPNEQLTHLTLWCLLAAPLLTSCDLSRLDPWTRDLLTNDDVLDIDQDPLGRPAGRRSRTGPLEVWSRPLSDGATAVGLFNRGREDATVTARWSDLGLHGRRPVRDLWRKKELGAFDGSFAAPVPAHGAVLVKVGRLRSTAG